MKYTFLIFVLFSVHSRADDLDLLTTLEKAKEYNPKIKVEVANAMASEQSLNAAKSNYLPSIDGAAIAADGSPGAFGLLGVDNNLSSTQRIGAGVGLVIKQMIYDFGRTSANVHIAQVQLDLQQKIKNLAAADVAIEILQTYLNCAALKNEINDANFIASQAQILARETDRFVNSGQRSIVERYLVDSQTKEAQTLSAQLEARKEQIEHRLSLQTGNSDTGSISCATLLDQSNESAIEQLESAVSESPLIDISKLKIGLAKERVNYSEADARPSFLAIGNGGYFDQQLNNDRWNYSIGVGLLIPIFEGFRIDSETQKQKYLFESEQRNSEAALEYVKDLNLKLTGEVNSARIQYEYLKSEIETAQKAYQLAKSRYLGYKGSMVDLRDALRNLARVKLAVDESKKSYLTARGQMAIFNGAIK